MLAIGNIKRCSHCRDVMPLSEFNCDRTQKDGMVVWCRKCRSKRASEYYIENRESILAKSIVYGKDNREKRNKYYKKRYSENKDKIGALQREYYIKNRKDVAKKTAEYREKNKDKLKKARKIWVENNRAKINADNKNSHASRMNRTPSYIDCSAIARIYRIAQIISALGKTKYHVDHIIPLQGKLVSGFHIETNLQILKEEDNLRKHNSFVPYIEEFDTSIFRRKTC